MTVWKPAHVRVLRAARQGIASTRRRRTPVLRARRAARGGGSEGDYTQDSVQYSFSTRDIETYLPGAHVLVYSDLARYGTIEEAMGGPGGVAIILVRFQPSYGHWIAVLGRTDARSGARVIEAFDPYGDMPDRPLAAMSAGMRERLGQSNPDLVELLEASPARVEYNEFALQSRGRTISTCGRWCVARVAARHWTPKQFAHAIDSICAREHTSPDEVVVELVPRPPN